MSNTALRDLIAGLFVAAGFAAIAYLSIQLGARAYTGEGGLVLTATFDEIGGLSPRSPVVIGGVTVGEVRRIGLDPETYRAQVTLEVDAWLELPEDTSASILTRGVLGDQYVALEPGGADALLASGDAIAFTQSAVVLERLIGRVVSNLGGGTD